ncbi:VOC family protein [Microbacterium sp. G2-8]|uniref:VOC family protein n=1 Tax=Microbacterium sp. G2-8 TaxID=2842454 RepID=UPI0021AA1050|nr:VOC family protein [Microbacterium sp. G2-8]
MTDPMPLIHHTAIYASDFETSERIFTAALATLDIVAGERNHLGVEYWREGSDTPSFCVGPPPRPDYVTRRVHVAFTAPDKEAVNRFYAAAVEAGARAKHAPRVWPEYAAYCCFVRDPDGNNIEAVVKLASLE